MIYIIDIFYSAGTPFRAFFNNHLFANIAAYERSAVRFPCHPYFIKGINTITISWGEIPIDNTGNNSQKSVENGPEFAVRLRTKNDWADDGRILFEKEMSPEYIAKYKGNKIPAYIISFANPSKVAFDNLFFESVVCNNTEDEFQVYLNRMRTFSSAIYESILRGSQQKILDSAKTAISDGSLAAGISKEVFLSQFRDILQEISHDGIGYSVSSPRQFIFLPTCGGRLWRAGFMQDEDKAQKIISETSNKPHALIKYDKDLIQSKPDGGLSQKIPLFLAFPDGQCEIVRVS
jgi:hypothetical protein